MPLPFPQFAHQSLEKWHGLKNAGVHIRPSIRVHSKDSKTRWIGIEHVENFIRNKDLSATIVRLCSSVERREVLLCRQMHFQFFHCSDFSTLDHRRKLLS